MKSYVRYLNGELKTPLDRLLDELILEARIWGMSEQLEQYYDTSTIERIRKEIKDALLHNT